MHIDSRATIEGVPLTVIRTLFRRAGLEGALTAGFVRDILRVSEPKAGALLRALMKAGFLNREKGGRWDLTTAGIRLRGSSGADRLGDVDVAVHLVPRSPDPKKHREANDRRVAEEEQKGRPFRTFLDQAFWWEQEAMLFLRNRRRGLSLQHYGVIREAVDASPHSLIFPKPESISTG